MCGSGNPSSECLKNCIALRFFAGGGGELGGPLEPALVLGIKLIAQDLLTSAGALDHGVAEPADMVKIDMLRRKMRSESKENASLSNFGPVIVISRAHCPAETGWLAPGQPKWVNIE